MRPRLVALPFLALAALAAGRVAAQQQPDRLSLELPKDNAWVGTRPKFSLRTDSKDVYKLRFRIELTQDGFKTIAYTLDQLKSPNGWAYLEMEGEPQGAVCFPQQKLAGGAYEWRAASWDGLSWKAGEEVFRVKVDDVPPAEVQGVHMRRLQNGCMHVTWDAVTVDSRGGEERVAKYHVFRYWQRTTVPSIGPMEAGSTPDLQYDDCDAKALQLPLLFYRVEAEDEAGNVFGRRIF